MTGLLRELWNALIYGEPETEEMSPAVALPAVAAPPMESIDDCVTCSTLPSPLSEGRLFANWFKVNHAETGKPATEREVMEYLDAPSANPEDPTSYTPQWFDVHCSCTRGLWRTYRDELTEQWRSLWNKRMGEADVKDINFPRLASLDPMDVREYHDRVKRYEAQLTALGIPSLPRGDGYTPLPELIDAVEQIGGDVGKFRRIRIENRYPGSCDPDHERIAAVADKDILRSHVEHARERIKLKFDALSSHLEKKAVALHSLHASAPQTKEEVQRALMNYLGLSDSLESQGFMSLSVLPQPEPDSIPYDWKGALASSMRQDVFDTLAEMFAAHVGNFNHLARIQRKYFLEKGNASDVIYNETKTTPDCLRDMLLLATPRCNPAYALRVLEQTVKKTVAEYITEAKKNLADEQCTYTGSRYFKSWLRRLVYPLNPELCKKAEQQIDRSLARDVEKVERLIDTHRKAQEAYEAMMNSRPLLRYSGYGTPNYPIASRIEEMGSACFDRAVDVALSPLKWMQ